MTLHTTVEHPPIWRSLDLLSCKRYKSSERCSSFKNAAPKFQNKRFEGRGFALVFVLSDRLQLDRQHLGRGRWEDR